MTLRRCAEPQNTLCSFLSSLGPGSSRECSKHAEACALGKHVRIPSCNAVSIARSLSVCVLMSTPCNPCGIVIPLQGFDNVPQLKSQR